MHFLRSLSASWSAEVPAGTLSPIRTGCGHLRLASGNEVSNDGLNGNEVLRQPLLNASTALIGRQQGAVEFVSASVFVGVILM